MTFLTTQGLSAHRVQPDVADSVSLRRAGLFLAVGFGLIAGYVVGHMADAASYRGTIDASLSLLLRFMAILKLAMVGAALALVWWRVGLFLSGRLATSYIVAVTLMACGPGLIWSTSTVVYGAVLFHGGLLVFASIALRDGGAWRACVAGSSGPGRK